MDEANESDTEYVDFPCPSCGEDRVDYLEWEDDETVKCTTCGRSYNLR